MDVFDGTEDHVGLLQKVGLSPWHVREECLAAYVVQDIARLCFEVFDFEAIKKLIARKDFSHVLRSLTLRLPSCHPAHWHVMRGLSCQAWCMTPWTVFRAHTPGRWVACSCDCPGSSFSSLGGSHLHRSLWKNWVLQSWDHRARFLPVDMRARSWFKPFPVLPFSHEGPA